MSKMRPLHALFVAFSVASVFLLWLQMALNGTLDAITEAKKLRAFPDGTPLKTTYLGVSLLDDIISTLVIFFYAVADGSDLQSRFLMIDICVTLHVALLWLVIESLRKGQTHRTMQIPVIWALTWNAVGAAVVLPVICLIQLQVPTSDFRLPLSHAKALIFATIGASVPMTLMLLPPYVSFSLLQHQVIIAITQIAPIFFVAIQYTLATGLALIPLGKEGPSKSQPYVMAAYIFGTVYGAAGHLYPVISAIKSGGLIGTYVPWTSRVDPSSVTRLTEGARLFLQIDNVVICLTCFLFTYLILEPHILTKGCLDHPKALPLPRSCSALVIIMVSTVVLGPAATVALGLWAKESLSRQEDSTCVESETLLEQDEDEYAEV